MYPTSFVGDISIARSCESQLAINHKKMKPSGKRRADTVGNLGKKRRHQAKLSNSIWEKFLAELKPTASATDLYIAAGIVLDEVLSRTASVRTAVYAASYELKKPLMAVVAKCMGKLSMVDEIITLSSSRSQATKEQLSQFPATLQQVLVHDICFGQPTRNNEYYRLIKPYEQPLKDACAEVLLRVATKSDSTQRQQLPRYVRINQLAVSKRNEVIDKLSAEGKFQLIETPEKWEEFYEAAQALQPLQFMRDFHMNRSLLLFYPSTQFYQHDMLTSGAIVLQDKASCLSALLLRPTRNSVVIDACAAPGMKTSTLAAIMHNTGQIYAVDRDEARVRTMRQLLKTCYATNVNVECRDFMRCDPHSLPFSAAEYILVDPSCSGSGIVAREGAAPDQSQNSAELQYNRARLLKLQSFQVMMLKHALSFPKVQRIVYSTCSIFEEENERVVEQTLQSSEFGQQFSLQDLSNYWMESKEAGEISHDREADDDFYREIQKKCLRLSPEVNLTNGFFIAVLERYPHPLEDTTNG